MAADAPYSKDTSKDAEFVKLMHGKSVDQQNSFISMLKKDDEAHRIITDSYVKHWKIDGSRLEDNQEARDGRKAEYASLVNNYYDIATDLYEERWAQSFHFCRFAVGETFLQALARHEHYMAYMINLQKGMRVLDVGCGVGRPAREIATFADCKIVGLNNNEYQVQRARQYALKEGLANQVSFVKGDFMHMDFPENSFDAVYAIEATVHAPSLQGVYEQIYRVLKPGGKFGVYEWVMTDKYDEKNPRHQAIRLGIERGSGIPTMMPRQHALEAIKAAGFILEHEEDLAALNDPVPWYYPLAGELRYTRSTWDLLAVIRKSWVGRRAIEALLGCLERVSLAPSGTAETAKELSYGADNLVAGGEEGLFTPMYFMIGRKPLL